MEITGASKITGANRQLVEEYKMKRETNPIKLSNGKNGKIQNVLLLTLYKDIPHLLRTPHQILNRAKVTLMYLHRQ